MRINENQFADVFVAALEKQDAIWLRPYFLNIAYNASHGGNYNGFNAFWLSVTASLKGYSCNAWMTFVQAKEYAKKTSQQIDFKGEKSTPIVFYPIVGEEKDDEGNIIKAGTVAPTTHYVFNVEQFKGLDLTPFQGKNHCRHEAADEMLDKIIKVLGVELRHNSTSSAYFSSSENLINTPPMGNYQNVANFYGSIFHEAIHATGTEEHLKRKSLEDYHKDMSIRGVEELTAEIGSAMILNRAGLLDSYVLENKQAYCNGWADAISRDPKIVRAAAGAAAKAVEYLLGKLTPSEEETQSKELAHS